MNTSDRGHASETEGLRIRVEYDPGIPCLISLTVGANTHAILRTSVTRSAVGAGAFSPAALQKRRLSCATGPRRKRSDWRRSGHIWSASCLSIRGNSHAHK